jgi:hypothetical protein
MTSRLRYYVPGSDTVSLRRPLIGPTGAGARLPPTYSRSACLASMSFRLPSVVKRSSEWSSSTGSS